METEEKFLGESIEDVQLFPTLETSNDQCALTARMYASLGTNWGIFGIHSDIQCENVRIYK